jgi:hypothetical protein
MLMLEWLWSRLGRNLVAVRAVASERSVRAGEVQGAGRSGSDKEKHSPAVQYSRVRDIFESTHAGETSAKRRRGWSHGTQTSRRKQKIVRTAVNRKACLVPCCSSIGQCPARLCEVISRSFEATSLGAPGERQEETSVRHHRLRLRKMAPAKEECRCQERARCSARARSRSSQTRQTVAAKGTAMGA